MSLAAYRVTDNGTIHVTGDYKFDSTETIIGMGQKTITITGDTLDLTGISTLGLNGAVTFDNANMKVGSNKLTVFANGHSLAVNSKVKFEGAIKELYGGNRGEIPLASTNINLQAGNYYIIYGGSRDASTITGDTNVLLGGTVNNTHPDFKLTDHKYNEIVCVYAGSRNGLVKGNTNVTMEGNATTSYVHGGGWGQSSEVSGTCNVFVNGGNVSGYYGGSLGGKVYKTNVVITGGIMEQVFGGSWVGSLKNVNASITGETNVTFTGGTVRRRIFGGCYNENKSEGNLVNGTSTLNIGGSANYTRDLGLFYDYILCAGSRYSTNNDAEKSVLNITTAKNSSYRSYINSDYGSSDIVNVVDELP